MRPVRSRSVLPGAILAVVLALSPVPSAQAEDLSKRWQLGGSISWQSTQDSIRSNAAFLLFDDLGDDGVPNTGDEQILFQDPRRDSLVERETTVDDDFRLDLLVAYGIKPWLSVQLDIAYFNTNLIQLDTYKYERRYVDNGDNLLFYTGSLGVEGVVTEEQVFEESQPIVPAEVTQIPVTASAVFRFFPERSWNLYLTAGVGYVFLDIDETERFEELNDLVTGERMLQLSTQQIPLRDNPRVDASEELEFLENLYVIESTLGSLDQPDPITIEAEDSFQFSLGVGADYFINSDWALDFEVRYLFVDEDIRIDVSGYDQLNYVFVSPEDLPGCTVFVPSSLPPDFDVNLMGIPGKCRPSFAFPLRDQVLVQGGTINLSSWIFRFGVRYVF